MEKDANTSLFQKVSYTNLVNSLSYNDINIATKETTKYVQQEREQKIKGKVDTEEKMQI